MPSRRTESSSTSTIGCGGISAGSVVAFIISWKLHHALIWALIAAIFGWGYVIYALIFYLPQITQMLG